VHASGTGDLEEPLELLEEDVVLYTDGGGKAFAVPNPIYGRANVVRAIVAGGAKFRPTAAPVVSRKMHVNGAPGVVTYLAGRPLYVVTVETRSERISSIYFITNTDKLVHVPAFKDQGPFQQGS
jgi:RNA polymerase sigma-70 factor, ECF subfamily